MEKKIELINIPLELVLVLHEIGIAFSVNDGKTVTLTLE